MKKYNLTYNVLKFSYFEVITRKMEGEKLKFQFTRIRKAIIIVIE